MNRTTELKIKIVKYILDNNKEVEAAIFEWLTADCPNRDICGPEYLSNYEPDHDEGRD